MPPHSSHLLQPLDVGCFGPLKKVYGREIEPLIRYLLDYSYLEDGVLPSLPHRLLGHYQQNIEMDWRVM
jgi:hypothetical protein